MAIAFTGVTIVPMDTERVAPGHTVLVEGDRITWVGADQDARLPEGTRRIDGRGRFVMPGLTDMHVHPMDEGDLLLCLAYGVTSIRVMWGLPRHLLWRDRTAGGELPGPIIHTAGPVIDGRPVRNPWSISVTTIKEAERAVAETRLTGHESIKVYDQLAQDAYDWLVRAARDQGLTVVGHVPFSVGLLGALGARQRTIEHLYGYIGEAQPDPRATRARPLDLSQLRTTLLDWSREARTDRLPELAEATRAARTWNCPTLIVRRRWAADRERLLDRPEMRYLTPAERAKARRFVTSYPDPGDAMALVDFNSQTIKALHDAGAGLLAGTDARAPGIVHGASMSEELGGFVAAGLTPYEALRTATTAPAEYYGAAGEWGVVRSGARADLLLLDADPLADVDNVTRIAGVMARGRWYPADDLRERLDALAACRAVAGPATDAETSTRRAAPSPSGPRTRATTVRYRVEQAGRILGTETLTVELADAGGRRLVSYADIDAFGTQLTEGWEAGSYRAEVDIDPDGRDRRAVLTSDCLDGPLWIELVRRAGKVVVRRSDSAGEENFGEADEPLFGWPLIGLYARIGARLTGLGVGGSARLTLIGPGLPPYRVVNTGTVRALRLPDADGARRFLVKVRWVNAWHTGTLTWASDGLPGELELTGNPPVHVRRVQVS